MHLYISIANYVKNTLSYNLKLYEKTSMLEKTLGQATKNMLNEFGRIHLTLG